MGEVVPFPVERVKPSHPEADRRTQAGFGRHLTAVVPIPRSDPRSLAPNHPVFSGGPKGVA